MALHREDEEVDLVANIQINGLKIHYQAQVSYRAFVHSRKLSIVWAPPASSFDAVI